MAMQSDQEFAPTQIARAVFPTAFRGYDQDAVRRYLSRLAAALEHQQEYAGLGELEARTPAHERVEELESEIESLRAEINQLELELVQRSVEGEGVEAEAAPVKVAEPAPVDTGFDEHRAIELLGQETARVLESARSAAADILKRAETQAASLKADAKTELEEARRRAQSLVATKQAETDELVANLATEAEATATRITTEAEEHRAAVVEESSKILSEAEDQAAAEQAGAEERAKQIVADAETLRQQVISELVAERREAQGEMDRMTAARDRLAMSLAVARTELDEVADALVDVSNVSFEVPKDSDAGGSGTHEAEVEALISTLEPSAGDAAAKETGTDPKAQTDADNSNAQKQTSDADNSSNPPAKTPSSDKPKADGPKPGGGRGTQPKKKRAKRRKGAAAKTAEKSKPAAETTTSGATQAEPVTAESATASSKAPASFDSGSDRFEELRRNATTVDDDQGTLDLRSDVKTAPADKSATTDSAREPLADVVPDRAVPDAVVPDDVDVTAQDDTQPHAEEELVTGSALLLDGPAEDPDEPIDLDKIIEMGLAAEVIGEENVDEARASDLNTPPADGEELSLVQGFTTIDLSDDDSPAGGAAIDLTDAGVDGTAADGESDLVHSVVVNEPRVPEELITTVSSRTAASQPDRTRGDLLVEEPFTGRLPKEFAARDLALTRSGPNFRRQLRRALNDDQSDVLDRLRAGRGPIQPDELPPFGEQIDRYLAPLRRGLAEIAQAGATAGGQSDLSQSALDNLVRQLAKYIVDKVRVPTIAVLEENTDHDRERILEPIRSLYRDFRNVGLPDLTEDALYEAFAIGLYDSIEPSAPISWVTDPRSDPDPVCEINRQRDDVVKGVVFPSGHARPLSLPGCRCLVMLADY